MKETADNHANTGRASALDGPVAAWAVLAVAVVMATFAFWDSLAKMVGSWSTDEYSHGYYIPLITLFLLWRNVVTPTDDRRGAWLGVVLVVLALIVGFMGSLGTIYIVVQYAFLLMLIGLALAFLGWRAMKAAWIPMIYLGFMIPLPQFLYQRLSSELQLISSEIGVGVVRLFGVSVFLDGNLIDLGAYQLQVAEACSGLRYLFPLLSFGFLVAYLYRGPFWQRAVLLLSTIPVTILMNSARIGIIGVMVDRHGIEMAEGVLHLFEGWVIFMTCVAFLFFEVWLFTLLQRHGAGFLDSLRLWPEPGGQPMSRALWAGARTSVPLLSAAAITLVALTAAISAPTRVEVALDRAPFATFPDKLADWQGDGQSLDRPILDALSLSDYVLSDFQRQSDPVPVNFYVAYYDSQTSGHAIHSPQSCIPGGGWQISDLSRHRVADARAGNPPLTVNRTVIAKGRDRQLVYYWFVQRDRLLTSEYAVKWFIFWDALTRNRTDGALIRVVTPVFETEGVAAADSRLAQFVSAMLPNLTPHLPGG